MKTSKTKKIFFWLLMGIFLCIFFELVSLAFLHILNLKSSSQGYPNELWVYDENLDYKDRPNFRGHFSGQLYNSIEININSLGLRDFEFKLAKAPGVYRILVLGDSITFGAGIRLKDTYVKQTEKLLDHSAAQPYQLINAGVSGYHFRHYYIFIKDNIAKFDPDSIVIGFCINDVRPMDVVRQKYVVRGTVKAPLSSTVKHDIKRIIKKSPSFQLASYLIFSNTYNRKKYSARWITEVMMSWNKEGLVEKLMDMLEEIKRLTEERGVRLSVIIFPEMNQLIDYEKYGAPKDKLLNILEDLNIAYLDLYDTFRHKEDFSQYYLPGDTVHFTAEGHKIIAEELKKFLIK